VDTSLGEPCELDELVDRRQAELEPRRAETQFEQRAQRFDLTRPGDRLCMTVIARPHTSFGFLWVIYLVAGGIVSATHHYWQHLHSLKAVVSAILAVLLWPLLLVGINLHIH
jgi:hypothetical protein